MNANEMSEIQRLFEQMQNRMQMQKEREREYMRNYMREYSKTYYRKMNEEQKNRHRACALKLTYEEYMARKESGLIKRGRPKKVVDTTA